MKLPKFIQGLILLALVQVAPSYADQPAACLFGSPLSFNGTQWQVKSSVGPIYLARKVAGAWKVLAVFDGTNGKYHLNWETPTNGDYAALDSTGAYSEPVRIRDDRASDTGASITAGMRTYSAPAAPVFEPSAFYHRAVAMVAKP